MAVVIAVVLVSVLVVVGFSVWPTSGAMTRVTVDDFAVGDLPMAVRVKLDGSSRWVELHNVQPRFAEATDREVRARHRESRRQDRPAAT